MSKIKMMSHVSILNMFWEENWEFWN